ncbi:MAG: hypothetical protein A2381_18190 [Bdellovibrionales bacterium RIFOXYB1_FULL_37_110]|nr:MAG: hypothetical protein A2417_06655 [Bdellovibrionales bacterium RIFOXYC1_FULL_37_79]OFZ58603.1 MAG: hypothetical protein A2381_18190 [Bdellovibrionales bacterium RIFOXYB1_FULL_37_110]OFZ61735.1 MAG: hypothetical protein A2577_19500 [Bdellovibrionales bacterium RIFOXYD1_FULL_36_51]
MNEIDDSKISRIGRYLILDNLNQGGMGKINLSLMLGNDANKVVIIKRIKQEFFGNEMYENMFLDEIKVTIDFNHPGITQVLDYGRTEGQLYLVIEYVEGKNLSDFLKKLQNRNLVLPLEISVYIISTICQALYYAHNFTNKLTGQPAKIIHRDVSPENIMITYSGTVKLIDFGIVKSKFNTESSSPAAIKGKLSYIAPEYLMDIPLDHRYDMYSTGIVLWELICNRKLFEMDEDQNKFSILEKIVEGKIPVPSAINPNIPDDLDQIVLKMLKTDPNDRYTDMDAVNRELTNFLHRRFPGFNPTDLRKYAIKLFSAEKEQEEKKLLQVGKMDFSPYLEEIQNEKTSTSTKLYPEKEKGFADKGKNSKPPKEEVKASASSIHHSDIVFNSDSMVTCRPVGKDAAKPSLKLDLATITTQVAKKIKRTFRDKFNNLSEMKPPKRAAEAFPKRLSVDQASNIIFIDDHAHPQNTNLRVHPSKHVPGHNHFSMSKIMVVMVMVAGMVVMLMQIPSVKILYGEIRGYQGHVILNNIKATEVTLQLNEKIVEYSVQGLPVPVHQEFYLQVIKKGFAPYIKKILINNNNEKVNLTVPNFLKQPKGYLQCVGENFPPNSFLKIEMPKDQNYYFVPVPFKKITLPVGEYNAFYQDQPLKFIIHKESVASFRIK